MNTVMASYWISRTVDESGFGSATLDIVQPDLTGAIRDSCKGQSLSTIGGESQLSAGHLGIRNAPEVITHCAPGIVVADLHTPTIGSTSSKSDGSLSAGG